MLPTCLFLIDVSEDSIEYVGGGLHPVTFEGRKYEICIIRLPRFILTFEIGDGNATHPVLMVESLFEGNVRDWSADMVIDSSISLQMAYYNSNLGVWEPLIEPIGVYYENVTIYQPWELKLDVWMNKEETSSPKSAHYEEEIVLSGRPKISVVFSTNTNLEITISKSTLEKLTNVGEAFSDKTDLATFKPSQRDNPPYKIINKSGLNVKINCEKSKFYVYQQVGEQFVIIEHGVEATLQLKEEDKQDYSLNEILGNVHILNKHLYVTMIPMECEIELNLARPATRFFSLNYHDGRDMWAVVATTMFEANTNKVILSSIVKIYNHLHLPINVYSTPKGKGIELIGSIEPEKIFYVPVNAVYTPTNELFFSVQKYSITTQPFVWKYLYFQLKQTQILQCPATTVLEHSEPFVMKTISNVEQIYNENTVKSTMNSILCNIHVHPAVLFRNCLPYKIYLTVQNIDDEFLLETGCTLPITNGTPGASYIVVRIPDYLDKEWICIEDIPASSLQFSVWTFDCYDSTHNVSLELGIHSVEDNGPLLMTLFCPFWMLNKSELNIAYKTSDENFTVLHHPANFKGPILYSVNAKNMFSTTTKTAIKIEYGGDWSDKFSLEAAGSSGVITCKHDCKIYQFGVNIAITYNGLTKQVTFTPYYVLINNSPFPLECREHDRLKDPWTPVQPHSCAALWPVGDFDDKLLRMRVVGSTEVSPPFYFSDCHNTVLKLANKYGGIQVDVQITEGAVYITFAKYEAGMAKALIINNTRNTLNIWEKDNVQLLKLDPGHKMLYSWTNPSKARVICWEAGYKKEIEDDLRKDGHGDYKIGENNHVHWASFLDGMQRTLLFTCNPKVAKNVRCSRIFENIDQEVTLSLFGLGISVVNNNLKKEVMYIAIASSGVIWETCKHGSYHFKQMSSKASAAIEASYKKYLCMKKTGPSHGRVAIDTKTVVNFETFRMLKPHARKIRRTFLNGIWLQMTTNPYVLQLHAKINRIQIDNQSYDCIFPVVLAPVSSQKSVAGTEIHKPFAELSVVQMLIKHSKIKQFKYFKLLVQEFHINLELGFVMAVSEVFQTSLDTIEKQKARFLDDAELVNRPLYHHVSQQSQDEQMSFYDLLHFSPLKVHVSFSLGGASGADVSSNAVSVLLQSLGVTLTDMQDVIFRIAYFEREYMFLTQKQLIGEATSHYLSQAVKQLYAVLLGLDVLGNPYGFVLGITKGVEDFFYEPIQGAIQGPGEFVEGLALGVRSLFGHTVGGAAGAVSRITGAMGKGIAALTFDKEFQRKRRDALIRKSTVSEELARSGKGLFMGVFDGVTGIVRKPISGARKKGVGGFFKGLGKGAVGLVARPTSGVIDFASGSLNTVRRVTELSAQEINRLRPSRYIYVDGLIRPYNEIEAIGNRILIELEKGKFALTDTYLQHFYIVGKKEILILTDQRLLYVNRNDMFGSWQECWSYTWDEISMPPKIVTKGILVRSSDQKKKKTLFAGTDAGKTIPISNPDIAELICLTIIQAYNTHYS